MSEGMAHSAPGVDPHAQHKMGMIGSHSVSMNHGMKALREKLLLKAACRDRCPTVVDDSNTTPLAGPSCPSCPVSSNDTTKGLVEPGNAGESSHSRLLITLRLRQFDRLFDGLHMVQTLLHLIHMFIAYILMLVVMTYNVYMLIAVISGFTLGYFVFARQRPLLLRSHTCCH
ncbi:solute carrier family 31 (copper transporter) member 1 [Clonorchis sinensis]|uniref:Copper transport protein n=1 Tax=Clonorchis sinensis TaxID=79923 RepID=G7YRZ7_CLOSI|nr:solute carrier family 31 (copper transporter) member 1 [Clonorchis sinensis]